MASNDVISSIEDHIKLLKSEQARLKLLEPKSWLSAVESRVKNGFSASDLGFAGASLSACVVCLSAYINLRDVFEKSGQLDMLCFETEKDIDKEIKKNKIPLTKTKVLEHLERAKELISECYPPALTKRAF